jgi:polyhydroxybutyrate depolymerase
MKLWKVACLLWCTSAQAQTTVVDSFLHQGIYRSYRLYIPAVYSGTQPVPLVFNLHGYGSNATEQQFYGDFMAIADTANFLIVHPNGTKIAGAQYWNAGYIPGAPYDLDFLETLIDTLALHYNINQDRVYSTGMSNGGIMSYYMACQMNNRIAAMASVTGSMTNSMYSSCTPATPVPVLQIHGTADGTVPYNGNSSFTHVDTVIKYWYTHNNTSSSPVVYNYPNINSTDGCTATEYRYENGYEGSETVLIKITGGGHTWPGAPVAVGVTNMDFSASVRIWEFFSQYQKSQFSSVATVKKFHEQLTVFPNPTSGQITVRGTDAGETIRIFTISGKLVAQTRAGDKQTIIDMHAWPSGMYTVTTLHGTARVLKQ